MVVKTRKTKKSVKSVAKKATRTVFKVTASYTGKFATLQAAKDAVSKLKQSGKAQISPVKKVGKGYGFIVKFAFVTASTAVKNQAAKDAKAKGARVTVSTIKV
ncbi:MAG: hypothetical protein AAGU10_08320 [Methanosarcina mazei]